MSHMPALSNPTLISISDLVSRIEDLENGGGGGGGGGWTAASSISATTNQVQIGGSAPPADTTVLIAGTSPTREIQLWVQDTATDHVGTDQNQAIACVMRQMGTSDATSSAATATGLDIAVTQTKSAGANSLTNTCILANASGGTTNYSFYSSTGQMVQTGDAHFGAADFSSNVSITGTLGAGATTVGGNLIATGLATLGTVGTGSTHVVNGNINLRSSNADTWLNIKNNSTGGRDWFIEASGDSGTDPNCLAVYDNTAGATRLKVNSSGHVIANVKLGVGSSLWTSGTGSPEGVVTGNKGDMYSRTDGGAATCLYVKESTGGNTGWVAK